MIVLESMIAAAIPAALYVAFIYFIDRYEREPLWLVGAVFVWGAVPSIILALIFNGVLGAPLYLLLGDELGDMATAVFVAPLVEETAKGFALLLLFWFKRHEIDSPLDGIIYGAMVGLGFAMVENVFYFLDQYAVGGVSAWQTNIFMRAVVFGLNHAMYTAMIGLGLAVARLTTKRWVRFAAPFVGWATAVMVHFLHNFFASAVDIVGPIACIPLMANAWGGLFITAVIVVWSTWQEHTWIKKYLFEEVSLGVLTPPQYVAVSSGWRRWAHRVHLLFNHGFRASRTADKFYTRASELAYSKHHYRYTPDGHSHQRIVDLRQEVMRLGQEMF
ncbi:MAG: PrsW family intramembrane metalloprotease [Anaerolineales bacterium]|nr:PrsW family intramembrane metalloprotease [Anaerolineales bacterium]